MPNSKTLWIELEAWLQHIFGALNSAVHSVWPERRPMGGCKPARLLASRWRRACPLPSNPLLGSLSPPFLLSPTAVVVGELLCESGATTFG
jgi:hypothetical protein